MIEKTTDYKIFNKFGCNRKLDPANLRKIKNSILSKNLLQWRPILVNTKMEVLDGQHRLEVAQELGLEVYYQIQKDSEDVDIILLNNNQKAWDLEAYRNYYENKGNINYLRIRKFYEQNNITISEAFYLLSGQKGGNLIKAFKEGKFIYPDEETIQRKTLALNRVEDIIFYIDSLKTNNKKFLKLKGFRTALITFLSHPDVEIDTLKSKISQKINLLRPVATWQDYVILLKDIYNWKNHNPID